MSGRAVVASDMTAAKAILRSNLQRRSGMARNLRQTIHAVTIGLEPCRRFARTLRIGNLLSAPAAFYEANLAAIRMGKVSMRLRSPGSWTRLAASAKGTICFQTAS